MVLCWSWGGGGRGVVVVVVNGIKSCNIGGAVVVLVGGVVLAG